ncbi:MAG: LLM class F420-dependent oxidoreductase [Microbacteriaceae bacterium]|nr:LLM class F420-dependent oxidoreductase [Cryobacterium sp.]MBX3103627.1 LLM class F420-dependent oxidoreductase [Cryobacterium sp.]MCC6376941.1 LLM class F420-dependent oxidoreductase [Microbacteriaceae bacterium]
MKFGLFIPQGWRHDLVGIDPKEQWTVMNQLANRADAGAWESIWVFDHFHTVPEATDQATHEAWTLMAAFAATTKRVRLGQMCTCISYRNPAYLAKVAATVDLISNGRVEMGIGAGWYEHEWLAYGYGFPSAGERLGRLEEGVRIMQHAWTEGKASLTGKYYQVSNAIVEPRPLQPEGIPIWIAGGGEKVTLRIAAQFANCTNFADGDIEVFNAKSAILQEHCVKLNRPFDAIRRSTNVKVVLGESVEDVANRLSRIESMIAPYVGAESAAKYVSEYRETVGVGTVPQVIAGLQRLKDAGLDTAIIYCPEAAYDPYVLDLLETEVIPALT